MTITESCPLVHDDRPGRMALRQGWFTLHQGEPSRSTLLPFFAPLDGVGLPLLGSPPLPPPVPKLPTLTGSGYSVHNEALDRLTL